MYRDIVSLLARNTDNIESHFCKIWIHDTTIVSIIGLPFLTHEEIKCGSDRWDELIRTVRLTTRVVSISDILGMFWSIDHFRIDPTSDEPCIDDGEVIVSISWSAGMMILSFPFWEVYIPVMRCDIETAVIAVLAEIQSSAIVIVPSEPRISHARYIYARHWVRTWRWWYLRYWSRSRLYQWRTSHSERSIDPDRWYLHSSTCTDIREASEICRFFLLDEILLIYSLLSHYLSWERWLEYTDSVSRCYRERYEDERDSYFPHA
jgi:hypothetical protein